MTNDADLHQIDHYDFQLPKELIAQHPLSNREDARLMSINRQTDTIDHFHIRDLPELLNDGDCLILNDTRVLPAKLVGYRTMTRGRWQGLFLEADENDNWKMLCKTRGSIKVGETVTLQDRHGVERTKLLLIAKLEGGQWIGRPQVLDDRLGPETTEEVLELVGRVPLPHYIRGGHLVDADLRDYQTLYAKHNGAVAAPTAGLHMTKSLVQRLRDKGVKMASVTLHVGIGTFRPVQVDDLSEHNMHSEWGRIEQGTVDLINETRASGGRVIAVGTTSVRVLESAAAESTTGELMAWSGDTNLFIRPPYSFKAIDGLITNFHLPRSTLLVLVRTFGGDLLLQQAYQEAVEEKYRFFSYGDAMMIL